MTKKNKHTDFQKNKKDKKKLNLFELEGVRLNNFKLSSDQVDNLLTRIHASHARQQKQKRHKLYAFVSLSAACMFILLWINIARYINYPFDNKTPLAYVSTLPADSAQQEITLIMENSETIRIDDNSVIEYDTEIKIQNDEKQKTILKKPQSVATSEEKLNTLLVPRGRRSSLVLADGSKIWINAGSVLRFPSSFTKEDRTIYVNGEIYIEVAKDKDRPFYVQTQKFKVNVLGTKFNVSAYDNEEVQSVVLVEGNVAVNTDNTKRFTLAPNQQLVMEQDMHSIRQVNALDHISWKDGIFQFNGETVEQVMNRLGRYYNMSINCNPAIAKQDCAGRLILFDRVDSVMQTFSLLYDIKYKIESNTITIE